jgi:hypothetical protein
VHIAGGEDLGSMPFEIQLELFGDVHRHRWR